MAKGEVPDLGSRSLGSTRCTEPMNASSEVAVEPCLVSGRWMRREFQTGGWIAAKTEGGAYVRRGQLTPCVLRFLRCV